MGGSLKATVSVRALVARINRKLAERGEQLKKTRSARDWPTLGDWYVVDLVHNAIVRHHVDVEELARELGVLAPFESVEEEDAGGTAPAHTPPTQRRRAPHKKGLKSKPGQKRSLKGGKAKGGGGGGGG